MAVAASPRSGVSRDLTWNVAGLVGLLIIAALAVVPLSLTILYTRESDTLVIDMAGRQRMLLERHMKEVLLAAQGRPEAHAQTLDVLRDRLHILIHGGDTMAHMDRGGSIVLPAAPTEEIARHFRRQEQLLDELTIKTEALLRTPPTAPGYAQQRDDLLKDHAALLEQAHEAVALLTDHSDASLRALMSWEVLVVVLVVTLASARTWRFLQAERALKASQVMTMDALRQRDAVKSALLSSVSHDLRTPLTAIKTMVFGLQQPCTAASERVRQEFLQNIDGQVDYLNRLVGNLLDMSRLEAGTVSSRREWHVLDELVEGAIRRVEVLLAGRPLHVCLDPDLPPISVDGVQIQQVLVNLLDNAIKFSCPASPIRIRASLMGPRLEVGISNQGEGVPLDQLDRIFDRFYRTVSARMSGSQGTGLGLAICKSIIEAHGGQIEAQSVPGGDTTIRFQLPVAAAIPVRDGMTPGPAAMRRG